MKEESLMKLYKVTLCDDERDIERLQEEYVNANYDEEEAMISDLESIISSNRLPNNIRTSKEMWDWASKNIEDWEDMVLCSSYEDFKKRYDYPNYELLNGMGLYDEATKALVKVYYQGVDEAVSRLQTYIGKLEESLKDKEDWEVSTHTEYSRSWDVGNMPSEYFSFTIENLDNDIDETGTIRICNGHDNGRNHSGQIDITECVELEEKGFVIDENKLAKQVKEALFDSCDMDICDSDFPDDILDIWDKWYSSIE